MKNPINISTCDVSGQEHINQQPNAHLNNTLSTNMWGDDFINFSMDKELWEKYSAEDEELKEQVRTMLHSDESRPAEKMVLIDTLQRLGVAYHFEDEIEEILQQLFGNIDYNEGYDLYNVALHFRIFRQHGFRMSCDVFKIFQGSDGKLKETWTDDVRGILGLYEAAYLATHDDDILDEALDFTKTRLQTMIPNLSSSYSEQVKRALSLCLHRSLPRVEAINYIHAYRSDPLRNETLLRFATIDYNLLQLLHLQELSGITEWWKDIISNLPYVRDRVVECYWFSLAVFFEPHYTVGRTTLAKMICMALVLDDTFDAYGTLDELKVFDDAIQRWDADGLELLPEYYKIVHKALTDLIDDLSQQFTAQGRSYAVSHVKQQEIVAARLRHYFDKQYSFFGIKVIKAKNLVRSYYIEEKWFKEGQVKSFDDYLANGIVSSSYLVDIPLSFLGMKEADTNDAAFDWVEDKPKSLFATAIVGRLLDDIASYKEEKSRGQIFTGIDCYMYQYGVSEEDAVNGFKNVVENAWKDINEECIQPTPVSKHLLERVVNLARVSEVTYRNGDGFTHPEELIADVITSLLKKPMPLL